MKTKMGRPNLPKGKAKGVILAARFSPNESKRVLDAVRRSNQKKPDWIRNALLSAAENR